MNHYTVLTKLFKKNWQVKNIYPEYLKRERDVKTRLGSNTADAILGKVAHSTMVDIIITSLRCKWLRFLAFLSVQVFQKQIFNDTFKRAEMISSVSAFQWRALLVRRYCWVKVHVGYTLTIFRCVASHAFTGNTLWGYILALSQSGQGRGFFNWYCF